MGSSFKLIKIIAIVAVILILITMGVFVLSNTESFMKDSSSKLTLTDSNEFNAKWESYKGKQDGSKVKAMAERLILNAEQNKKDATMLPDIIYKSTESSDPIYVRSTVKGKEKANVSGLETFKDDINSRHTYYIKFVYSEKTKIISGIIVQYEQNDNIEFVPDET